MIVGTAGHIDHGKTSLVRALTGIDTDRLPEEKARAISIELGYAFLPVPGAEDGQRIGFIDVPGHERLVHTMISGATGIDRALLLVAADDGVMPQTREHLAVLSLLGIERGAAVITKIDRVDASRVEQVRAEVETLLEDSTLAGAETHAISVVTGQGIAELRNSLFAAARETPMQLEQDQAFRLAIDRVFTLDGVGTVATGTVHAGRVRAGDELELVPGGRRARVRSLHAQGRSVEEAFTGQRCAIGLAGLAKDQVSRGQWLVDPQVALASSRLDADIRLWGGETHSLRSGTSVHLHIGSASLQASVAVLGSGSPSSQAIAPGETALVQLVLHEAVGAWRGERIVLRDASAGRTIAGGRVLDPHAPTRYRRTPQRLAELACLRVSHPEARLRGALAARREGIDLSAWARAEGRHPSSVEAPPGSLTAQATDGTRWLLDPVHAASWTTALLVSLEAFHAREPELLGPDAARLRRLASPRLPLPLWNALLKQLEAAGRLASRGPFLHLPAHESSLSATEARIAAKIVPLLSAGDPEGRWARDLARDSGESESLVRLALARLAGRGELHQVVKDLFFTPATIERYAQMVRQLAAPGGGLTAASFRDLSGLGRKRAIQVLEYFDRIGLLRRVGDEHRVRGDTRLFEGVTM